MSRPHQEELLQQCLAAFDAGLSPEQCLAAFPNHRDELEPLFRQALALRIALAARPSETFSVALKQRLMFAAGGEVTEALQTAEPYADFIMDAKQRLLLRAGAEAQEALRSIPPPHLPFWVNARRRLLATASTSRPRPSLMPVFALRAGLSAAVLVLAMAIGGVFYMAGQNKPASVNAELASLDHQLQELEQQSRAGQVVSMTTLAELASRTLELSQRLEEQSSQPALAQKLDQIIDRQRPLVLAAPVEDSAQTAEVVQAYQQLEAADRRLTVIAETATPSPLVPPAATTPAATSATAVPPAVVASPTEEPKATASVTPPPAETPPAVVTPTPEPLKDSQIRIVPLTANTAPEQSWQLVTANHLRFLLPADWKFIGSVNAAGVAETTSNQALFQGNGMILVANIESGQLTLVIDNAVTPLREAGADGKTITLDALIKAAGERTTLLQQILKTVVIVPPAEPTGTPALPITPEDNLSPDARP